VRSAQYAAEWICLRRAVAAADKLALCDFGAGGAHWFKSPGQVVTAADFDVDAC
jgi:hypothetical protein